MEHAFPERFGGKFIRAARPKLEKTAKEFVGFKEAYRYEDTYTREPSGYPLNPEEPTMPPQ